MRESLSRQRVSQFKLFHPPQKRPSWQVLPPETKRKTVRLLARLLLGALFADASTGSRFDPLGCTKIQEAAQTSAQSNTLDRAHQKAYAGTVRSLADGCAAWLRDGSRMSREAHVRFYESLGVELPGATHPSK